VPDAEGLSTGAGLRRARPLDGDARRLDPTPLRDSRRTAQASPRRSHNDLQPPPSRCGPTSELGSTRWSRPAPSAPPSALRPHLLRLFADRAAAEQAAERLPGALVTALR
jgi:hypothetical protein